LKPSDDISDHDITEMFRRHGVTGPVGEVTPRAGDEAVFVVTPEGAASMREGELTAALQTVLRRKVWVVTDETGFEGRVRRL
jgi:hypothetical protein